MTHSPDQPTVTSPPLGATVTDAGVTFRVWAPDAAVVAVEIDGAPPVAMHDGSGIWTAGVAGAHAGARYRYRLDDRGAFPDPYSRSQPDGPHGASEVIDPAAFVWHDDGWRGATINDLVIYELHVGTFTRDGTFDAIIEQLDGLRDLGVNAIELMPVAEFPGARNWGYDGVDLFAPSRNYGGPDGLKRLVDAAHAAGIAVLLDVVYNHFGPDGNYLLTYSTDYVTPRHATPWGSAVNYDGHHSAMVRRFAVDNACYWLDEYHVDGLRLDATFAIFDDSPRHIVEEITTTARARVAPRNIVLIAETHENDARYLRAAADGGFGFDAVWADDFHHAVHTLATGERHSYYEAHAGTMAELAQTINNGWLFDGAHVAASGHTRGTPSRDVPASAFVYGLQNHDQIGNRPVGDRLSQIIDLDLYRAWSALLLLLPYTPLLFMGQEFTASTPFEFFTDHNPDLGKLVTEGRRREFPFAEDPGRIADPQAIETFTRSTLDLSERDRPPGRETLALFREVLRLRREDPVLRTRDRTHTRAEAVSDTLLIVERWNAAGARHLIAVNIGDVAAKLPVIAGDSWSCIMSSDEQRFGGAARSAVEPQALPMAAPRSTTLFASLR